MIQKSRMMMRKRQFYSADIIYTTNGALGFDFLFDNLVKKKGGQISL